MRQWIKYRTVKSKLDNQKFYRGRHWLITTNQCDRNLLTTKMWMLRQKIEQNSKKMRNQLLKWTWKTAVSYVSLTTTGNEVIQVLQTPALPSVFVLGSLAGDPVGVLWNLMCPRSRTIMFVFSHTNFSGRMIWGAAMSSLISHLFSCGTKGKNTLTTQWSYIHS